MNYFDIVMKWASAIRFDKGKVGAPYGNDNAAKDHIKQAVKKANSRLTKNKRVRISVSGIPQNDYERLRSRINSDYAFEKKDTFGQTACHWVADRGGKVNEGHLIFFDNNGRGNSEPKYRLPLTADNQEFLDAIAKEL